jgi:hypothetical protein
MPKKDPGPSVKDKKLYETARRGQFQAEGGANRERRCRIISEEGLQEGRPVAVL